MLETNRGGQGNLTMVRVYNVISGRTNGEDRGATEGFGWRLQKSLVPGGPKEGQGPHGLGLGPIVNPQAIVMLSVCTRLESAGQYLRNYA